MLRSSLYCAQYGGLRWARPSTSVSLWGRSHAFIIQEHAAYILEHVFQLRGGPYLGQERAHRRVGRRLDLRRLGSVSIRILLRQAVLALAERASGPIRASLRHQRIADVPRAERLKCCCQARSSNNEEVEMMDTQPGEMTDTARVMSTRGGE